MLGLLSSGISDFVLLPSHISKIFNFFPLSSRRVSIPVPNGRDTRGYGFVSFESFGCQPRPNRDNNIIDQGQPSSRARKRWPPLTRSIILSKAHENRFYRGGGSRVETDSGQSASFLQHPSQLPVSQSVKL